MPGYDAELFDPPAPMATVALRTLDRQRSVPDVVMLIDSGADVSLVPESSVRRLGLETDEQRGYEVMAFDGSKRVAKSVHCDLIFLGRAYGGVYLVVEGACGILGRDVLNHLSLVLDGPRLNWREEHASE
ncbi:MAG TPA: retropepsin-like aspartic protease [Thermoguttaceae bacterium]|nr:retropepsin-like aspartic protease [Thermoguttaceae bacterium]